MTALCLSLHGLSSLCMFNSPISETFNLKIQRGNTYNCKGVLPLILLSVLVLNNVYQVRPDPGLSTLLPPLLPRQSWWKCGQPLKHPHCSAELICSLMANMASAGLCVALSHQRNVILTEILRTWAATQCARRKL